MKPPYKKADCCGDGECMLFDEDLCYGEVTVTEEYDGNDHWWIHLCEGHQDYNYVPFCAKNKVQ